MDLAAAAEESYDDHFADDPNGRALIVDSMSDHETHARLIISRTEADLVTDEVGEIRILDVDGSSRYVMLNRADLAAAHLAIGQILA